VRTSRRVLIALAVVALLGAACGGSSSSGASATSSPAGETSSGSASSGFATYTNPSPPFTISYPQGWRTNTTVSGAIVAFLAPTTSTSDVFAENVNVLKQTVPSGTTLQQYTDASISSAGQVVQNFHQVSSTTSTLSGLPAQVVEYTGDLNGKSYHFFAEWAIDGTDAWVLTYSAEPDAYDQFLPDAKTTIESFHLG